MANRSRKRHDEIRAAQVASLSNISHTLPPPFPTLTVEPVTTEPVTTEPVTTEPVTTEPVTTEPPVEQLISVEEMQEDFALIGLLGDVVHEATEEPQAVSVVHNIDNDDDLVRVLSMCKYRMWIVFPKEMAFNFRRLVTDESIWFFGSGMTKLEAVKGDYVVVCPTGTQYVVPQSEFGKKFKDIKWKSTTSGTATKSDLTKHLMYKFDFDYTTLYRNKRIIGHKDMFFIHLGKDEFSVMPKYLINSLYHTISVEPGSQPIMDGV